MPAGVQTPPLRCPSRPLSIREIDATEIAPGLWQGGFRRLRGCPVAISDLDLVVLLAPDTRVTVVSPQSVRMGLIDSFDRMSRNPDIAKAGYLRAMGTRIAEYVRTYGARVGIFCAQGRNRSGFLMAMTLRKLYGCSGEQAANWIRSKRRNALDNPQYSRYLAEMPPPRGANA